MIHHHSHPGYGGNSISSVQTYFRHCAKVTFSGRENQWPDLNEADGEGFSHRRFSINVVDILLTLGIVSKKICLCLLSSKPRYSLSEE